MRFITIFLIIIFFFIITSYSQTALADFVGVPDPANFRFTDATIGEILTALLAPIFTLAGMIALLFLIWGGIRYMTSRGDPKAHEAARNTITSAVVGLLIILFVAAIFYIAGSVFRIGIFSSLPLVPAAYARVDIGPTVSLGGVTINVFSSFGQLFTRIVRVALALAAVVFLAMLVWGGFKYLAAGGDSKAADEARRTLTNAGVGLLIVIVSFFIVELATRVAGAGSIF